MWRRGLIRPALVAWLALVPTGAAGDPATIQAAARSPGWLKLLHYEGTVTGGWRSRADGDTFFLAPDGRTNPESELLAAANALAAGATLGPPFNASVGCVFPARADFVRTHVTPDLPVPDCPDLAAWESRLAVQGLTLIFASHFANNPASMFGHLLLRLESGDQAAIAVADPEARGLLGYGASFMARTPDGENPVVYTVKGVSGGYPGFFDLQPYYEVVTAYNNIENRDLWEYRLELTPDELRRLVRHLWELQHTTHFDYWFLDENCAFGMLALLEAALPDKDLVTGHRGWMLPVQGLRRLADAGLLQAPPVRRASLMAEAVRANLLLGTAERGAVDAAIKGGALPPAAGTRALDALIARLNVRKYTTKNRLNPTESSLLRAALVARANADPPGETQAPRLPASLGSVRVRPDRGHPMTGIDLGLTGRRQGGSGALVGIHLLTQDVLADKAGYERFSAMDLLAAEVLVDRRKDGERLRVAPGRITIADVTSLHPWSGLDPQFSWHLALFHDRLKRFESDAIGVSTGEAGVGLAGGPMGESALFYSLVLVRVTTPTAAAGAGAGNGRAAGPALRAGAIMLPDEALRLTLEIESFRDFAGRRSAWSATSGASMTVGGGEPANRESAVIHEMRVVAGASGLTATTVDRYIALVWRLWH